MPATFLDLFCGCGGFSLGLKRAGLRCVGAVDFDGPAIACYRANFSEVKDNTFQRDLTTFPPEEFSRLTAVGKGEVDVIVGGPPCQAYSTARQVDGSNNGARLKEDSRRYLYRELLRYVEFYRPKVFVMENVLGICSADGGKYFCRVQAEARAIGYRVHPQMEEAWLLGVPQKRRRQLVIKVIGGLAA